MSKINYDGQQYSEFRPVYSESVYSIINQFHKKNNGAFDVAIDVGTGTGQVAAQLAGQYKQVVGIDMSQDMLDHATKKDNISYLRGSAEKLPVKEDHSVDLITVATAFHWFNHDVFFAEAKRVLKSTGTLAVFGYFFPVIRNNEEASNVIRKLGIETLLDYFDPKIKYIINLYRDIEFPFEQTEWHITPSSEDTDGRSKPVQKPLMEATLSIRQLRNLIKTWSGYVNYEKENTAGSDVADDTVEEVKKILGLKDDDATIDVEWPFVIVLASNSPAEAKDR